MNDQNKKGFTLVELLVVIAIIGLLSTIAIVSLGSARAKARDTKRIADMKQLSTALEQYYSDQGGYPSVATAGTWTGSGTIPPATPAAANNIVLGSAHAKSLTSQNAAAVGAAGDTGSFAATAAVGTVYMGNVPSYPTPGKASAATDCSAIGAAYCYTSNTNWAAGTYSTAYALYWQLENTNPAAGLSGTNCITTSSGVTCS